MSNNQILTFNSEFTPNPVHPGRTLAAELKARNISQKLFHEIIKTPPNSIIEIIRGRIGISPEMALRLGHYFGTGPLFWWNLQKDYELNTAILNCKDRIEKEIKPYEKIT